jgi:succinate dehydrogenase/fumarate reductase flavoprotein subunit
MAGLVAAARARELGAEPIVYEKGTRAGGSMVLSSGFAWRYRSFELFREQCPGGHPGLQRLVFERFDEALDWLEGKGVELLIRETGNPLTAGARFDPRQLVDTLGRDVRLGETTDDPAILATGGFPVRLARDRGLLLRANPWSEGDGLDLARSRGAATAGDLDEFYGRAMPAIDELAEGDFVRLGQLYGRFASITSEDGSEWFPGEPNWSEIDVAQQIARWPGGRAWLAVDGAVLAARVRDRTVGEMVDAAREAGAPVEEQDGGVRVLVRAAVTQTLGGLRVDERACVLDGSGRPIEGLHAAGADVGGISNGGWSSGLATALVLGLVAGESAVG